MNANDKINPIISLKPHSEKYPNITDNKLCPIIPLDANPNEVFKEVNYDVIDPVDKSYIISNKGSLYHNIRNRLTRINGHIDEDGYKRITMDCTDGKRHCIGIHKLVLSAFYNTPNIEELKIMTNHYDGNKVNNDITNLEWVTNKENGDHAIATGLHKMHGVDNPNNKLSENDVRKICSLLESGKYCYTEIGKMFGVSYVNISDIHKGKIWSQVSKDYDMTKHKSRHSIKNHTPEEAE